MMLPDQKERILRNAALLRSSNRPNSPTDLYHFEEIVEFAKNVEKVSKNVELDLKHEYQSLLASTPDIALDASSESREHVEFIFRYIQLRNCMLEVIETIYRGADDANLILEGDPAQAELERIYQKLESIEHTIKQLEADAKELLKKDPIYDGITVNAWPFSIPVSSIRRTVSAAKLEIEKKSGINIEYFISLMTSAYEVANSLWEQTKKAYRSFPKQVHERVHKIAMESASAASNSLILLMRRRIKASKPRVHGFSKEAEAIQINAYRKQIIELMEDFLYYRPKSNDLLWNSALFRFIYYERIISLYSPEVVRQISRDMVAVSGLSTEEIHDYIYGKANGVLNDLSKILFSLEEEIRNQT
jgi:hypothetical protein